MSRVVDLLQSLIRIPSVNPDNATDPSVAGEGRIAEQIAGLLEAMGATAKLEEVLPGRPNVFGHFPSDRPGKPRILLAPHTDTVGIEGMSIAPFSGDVFHGRIYGRGASDTKGTMAAMLAALEALGADRISRLGAEIVFVGLIGEETGQHGSRHLARHHHGQFAFAVVGEPTLCEIVHVHKGCSWLTLETRGKACHGSTPEKGVSALYEMVPVLESVRDDLATRLKTFTHPILGHSTVNVGTIRAGARPNIVPDHCTIELDVRETPTLHRYGVDRLIGEWLTDHGWDKKVSVRTSGSCAPLDTPAHDPFVRKLTALGAPLTGAPWFCDAAWLSEEGGIPAVAAGPGSIAQAHTADEFIAIAHLEEGVRFYRSFLESL